MNAKTHFLSGVIAGYLVQPSWQGAVVGGLAALLPDIDEPRSFIGRLVPFLSAPLRLFVRHRTLTHSFLFAVATSGILYPFSPIMAFIFVVGLLAHIVGDMITGRVQLFWPLPWWVGIPMPRFVYSVIDRLVFFLLFSVAMLYFIKLIPWHSLLG